MDKQSWMEKETENECDVMNKQNEKRLSLWYAVLLFCSSSLMNGFCCWALTTWNLHTKFFRKQDQIGFSLV